MSKDTVQKWIDYYSGSVNFNAQEAELVYFYKLLKKYSADDLMLQGNPFPIEDERYYWYPENGLVYFDLEPIFNNERKKLQLSLSKISLLLFFGYDFQNFLKSDVKAQVQDAIEKSIISGEYEKFGINEDDLIKRAIEIKAIQEKDRIHLLFLRGMVLGGRYPDEQAEKILKKIIKKNKLLGIINFV